MNYLVLLYGEPNESTAPIGIRRGLRQARKLADDMTIGQVRDIVHKLRLTLDNPQYFTITSFMGGDPVHTETREFKR